MHWSMSVSIARELLPSLSEGVEVYIVQSKY